MRLVSRRLSLAIVSDCSRGFCGSKLTAGDGSLRRQVVRSLAAPARAAARTKGTRRSQFELTEWNRRSLACKLRLNRRYADLCRDDGELMRTSF
jgi:hypothetical protein